MKKAAWCLVALVLLGVASLSEAQRGREKRGIPVSIKNSQFSPARLSVKKGEVVVWTNNDDRDHTVDDADGDFSSGSIKPGKSYSHAFKEAGTYNYRCRLHPRMKGQVVVK